MRPDRPARRSSLPRWLSALIIAFLVGLLFLAAADMWGSFGYAAVLGLPLLLGFILGFLGIDATGWSLGTTLGLLLLALTVGALTANLAGLLCMSILAAVILIPLIVGATLGRMLGKQVRRDRDTTYQLILLLGLGVAGALYAESLLPLPNDVEAVSSARVLEISVADAWSRLVFYEEIHGRPPALALVGLPRPVRTEGQIGAVGDVRRCVYSTGHLIKRITTHHREQILAFEVLEQSGVEDRSVELIGGSFRFEPLPGNQTLVTLTTTYKPLLQARPIWRPFEHAVTRALHQHVLDGMATRSPEDPAATDIVLAKAPRR